MTSTPTTCPLCDGTGCWDCNGTGTITDPYTLKAAREVARAIRRKLAEVAERRARESAA
jgi:hypothetical protein